MKEIKVTKFLIYALVFLFPLFFFPFFQNALDFPKLLLFSFLLSLASIFYLISVIRKSKLKITFHFFHFVVLSFLFFTFLSFLFSKSRIQSLFGIPDEISSSLLANFLLVLFYFLLVLVFEKEEIFNLLITFSFSLFLILIFAFFQIFQKYLLPFDFTKTPIFNLVGNTFSFSVILACFLPFFILAFDFSEKFLKIFFGFFSILTLIFLFLLNHFPSLFVALLASALLLSVFFTKRELFDFKVLIFSLFSLSIILSFLILNFKILALPPEISLPFQTSFEIFLSSLKERPFLGSGPATFSFQFAKFKPKNFNLTDFWPFKFNSSASRFLTLSTTQGILGSLSYLSLLFLPLFFSFSKKETLILLPLYFSFLVFQFIYPANFFIHQFSLFLVLASLVKLSSEKEREIEFSEKKFTSFLLSLSLVTLFVLLIGNLILNFQTAASEYFYFKGIKDWQRGEKNLAKENLERATKINQRMPQYLRDLSQLYLAIAQEKLQKNQTDIQNEVFLGLDLAKKATEKEKENVANWAVRAFAYQSLFGLATGAEDWAIKCWQEAEKLEPTNPYFYTQEGIAFLRKAILEKEKEKNFEKAEELFQKAISLKPDYAPAHFQLSILYQAKGELERAISKLEETKNLAPFDLGLAFQLGVLYYQKGDYQRAKEELERAITLSPDYDSALYFLGLTYDKLGDKEKAIETFKKVLALNPDLEILKKIINNLEEGKEALEGIPQSFPPRVPFENRPSEIKE